MPVVRSSDPASATVIQSLTPSNCRAAPDRPSWIRVAPEMTPGFPVPDASFTVVPLASPNPYAATRPPVTGGGATVNVTATVRGDPEAPGAVIVTVPE
jgi:hypothetical protein